MTTSLPASATWSVVAVDPTTREVGIAAATCHPGSHTIAGVVPGRGVVSAQGLTSQPARQHAVALLQKGMPAIAILESITSSQVDRGWFFQRWLRQYGVASLAAPPLAQAYTGPLALPHRGGRQVPGVSVQGNVLRAGVLDAVLSGFTSTPKECGLPHSLLVALEAGAAAGGDRRCSKEQTALSAFLIVARPNDLPDQPFVRLVAPDEKEGGRNPVDVLGELFRKSSVDSRWRSGACSN
ncbi:MAG: DUF1028 domain-containing protein [Deltaproteobacteria bacterium]|nr:DUF1028 domain-containing protein [Deltaproteobacteria bacterium]MBW2446353.1 DUF1028 domain-containing protein [Deltaproteobacteria bacterium]